MIRRCVILGLLALVVAGPAGGAKGTATYETGFDVWRGADGGFAAWERQGTALAADGSLALDEATATAGSDPYAAGAYYGGNYYNAGLFVVGEATSPVVATPFPFVEAIASWNATTPPGSWVEVQIAALVPSGWTKWYVLGIWAADDSTVSRHSVRLQGDTNGFVAVDTLVLTGGDKAPTPASAYRLKLRLFGTGGAVPSVQRASVAFSTAAVEPAAPSADDPAVANTVLDVPECSQMPYPDGGNVWCSPTATSMVLAYWTGDTRPCEPRVREAVAGVFDWVYDGHGNWPFNTAYAATKGLEASVARLTSLREVERWVAAGVPVVFSFAWKKSELTGAAVEKSDGHLAVIVGFDAAGNPIVNDPAAATDELVQRTYDRGELEFVWQKYSGGTVYLIHPAGHPVPAL